MQPKYIFPVPLSALLPKMFFEEGGWNGTSQAGWRLYHLFTEENLDLARAWVLVKRTSYLDHRTQICMFWLLVKHPMWPLLLIEDPELLPVAIAQVCRLYDACRLNVRIEGPPNSFEFYVWQYYRSALANYGHWDKVRDHFTPLLASWHTKIPLVEKWSPVQPFDLFCRDIDPKMPNVFAALDRQP